MALQSIFMDVDVKILTKRLRFQSKVPKAICNYLDLFITLKVTESHSRTSPNMAKFQTYDQNTSVMGGGYLGVCDSTFPQDSKIFFRGFVFFIYIIN